jgi:hypothetical protein
MKKVFFALFCSLVVIVYFSSQYFKSAEPLKGGVAVTTSMHRGAGFFCELRKVIENIIHYEPEGMRSHYVDWTDEFFPFKDEPRGNGWDLYFEPIVCQKFGAVGNEPVRSVGNCWVHELHDQVCVAPWVAYDEYLPFRLNVHDIINKYIVIKPHIRKFVDSFYEQHMKGCLCVGVHVRYATIHGAETPQGHPSLDTYCNEVNNLLNQYHDRNIKIYLASDSHVVIDYFKKIYNDKLVYIDTYRARGSEDPGLIYEGGGYWMSHPAEWHKAKPGYRGGFGALVDCLLLSKCDYFIHITSNLAYFVTFFNPHIKSIYLPRTVPFACCRYQGHENIRNKFLNPIAGGISI